MLHPFHKHSPEALLLFLEEHPDIFATVVEKLPSQTRRALHSTNHVFRHYINTTTDALRISQAFEFEHDLATSFPNLRRLHLPISESHLPLLESLSQKSQHILGSVKTLELEFQICWTQRPDPLNDLLSHCSQLTQLILTDCASHSSVSISRAFTILRPSSLQDILTIFSFPVHSPAICTLPAARHMSNLHLHRTSTQLHTSHITYMPNLAAASQLHCLTSLHLSGLPLEPSTHTHLLELSLLSNLQHLHINATVPEHMAPAAIQVLDAISALTTLHNLKLELKDPTDNLLKAIFTIPPSWSCLQSLRDLRLTAGRVVNTQSLATLGSLTHLQIDHMFDPSVEVLVMLTGLRSLHLCQEDGLGQQQCRDLATAVGVQQGPTTTTTHLGSQISSVRLSFTCSNVALFPDLLSHLTSANHLELSFSRVPHNLQPLHLLSQLCDLITLQIVGANFDQWQLHALSLLPKLHHLSLSGHFVSSAVRDACRWLRVTFTSLQSLQLEAHGDVIDVVLDALTAPQLAWLHVRHASCGYTSLNDLLARCQKLGLRRISGDLRVEVNDRNFEMLGNWGTGMLNQLHLDMAVEDVRVAEVALMAAGSRLRTLRMHLPLARAPAEAGGIRQQGTPARTPSTLHLLTPNTPLNTRIPDPIFPHLLYHASHLQQLKLYGREMDLPEICDLGASCSQITSLKLQHASNTSMEAVMNLVRTWPALRKLSLISCPQLTDDGLARLGELRGLGKLEVGGALGLTPLGLRRLLEQQQPALSSVCFRGCGISPSHVEQVVKVVTAWRGRQLFTRVTVLLE